ncbi:site-specific integrase, partial [bacterium]|nr:site-specific integrase [bacterium]
MEDLIKKYLEYLNNNGASKNTVKNYSSDLNKFVEWLSNSSVTSSDLSKAHLLSYESYITPSSYSVSSKRRLLSTAKSFTEWKLTSELFEAIARPYLLYLESKGASKSTLKNYSSDISRFVAYLVSTSTTQTKATHITQEELNTFKKSLNSLGLSKASVRRVSSSLSQFYIWSNSHRILDSGFKPLIKRNYKKYLHPLTNFRTFGYSLALIALLSLAYSSFPQIHAYTQNNVLGSIRNLLSVAKGSVLGTTAPNYLSYQGRLIDNNGSPITTNTNFVFKIYNSLTGGTELWNSGSCSITPDNDGIFNSTLGSSCGAAFTPDLFANNPNTYLQVTIGAETLTPRQPISAVPYAINSDSLDGVDSSSFMRSDLSDTFTGSFDQTATYQSNLTGNRSTSLLSVTQSNDPTYSMSSNLVSISQADTSSTGGALYLQNLGSGISFRVDDTATDTTPFVIDNSGNVGIGTSTPAAFLDVAGSTTGQASVRVESGTVPSSPGIGDIYSDGTDLFFYDGVGWVDLTYGDGGSGAASWSNITSPTSNLSLSMSNNLTTFNWATGTGTNNLFNLTSDNSATGTGALLNIKTGTSSTVAPLRVRAGNTEALYINPSGSVSVGTTTPNTQFSVLGSSDISGSLGIGTTSPNFNLHISSVSDSAIYLEADRAGSASDDNNAFIKLSQDGGGVQSIIGTVGNANFSPENVAYTDTLANATLIGTLDANGALHFGTNDAVRMTIGTTGNISIGTTATATSKLDIVGGSVRTDTQFISTVVTGTAPLSVASTTLVTNLNADQLDGLHESSFFNLSENEIVLGKPAFNGGTTAIDAPFTVDSTYLVSNLNADLLDGKQAATFCWTDGSNCPSLPSGGGWTDAGTVIYNTTTTDNVSIGTSSSLAKLTVDGDTDEVQFLVQGHSAQTNNLVVFENSAGADLFTLNNAGNG